MQMSVAIVVASRTTLVVRVGTPSMIREQWGATVETSRSLRMTEESQFWTPAKVNWTGLGAVGIDVAEFMAAAIAYAAAFDVVTLAKSMEELGLLSQ